jgi:outer membrane immunogenic protein
MFVRSLTLGVAAVALMAGSATAADLFIPTTPEPIYAPAGFDWEGLYAGIEGGGIFSDGDTAGLIGGVVGVNFIPADPILVGLEIQADYVFGDGTDAGLVLALGRVGAVVTDQVLVYASGGVGAVFNDVDDAGVYALGGGVEFAVTDSVSVRGEVLGLGTFDDGDDFFTSAKATVGVFYHF